MTKWEYTSSVSELTDFVNSKLADTGWTYNELARRADLSSGGISNVMTGLRRPGFDFCVGVARAFGEPPERVLRLTGLLPSLPEDRAKEEQVLYLFRDLGSVAQDAAISMLRGLAGQRPGIHDATLDSSLLHEVESTTDV